MVVPAASPFVSFSSRSMRPYELRRSDGAAVPDRVEVHGAAEERDPHFVAAEIVVIAACSGWWRSPTKTSNLSAPARSASGRA